MLVTYVSIILSAMMCIPTHGLPTNNNPKTIQSKLEQNSRLFEGDIHFPVDQQPSGRSLAVVSHTTTITWPNGIVPYEFALRYTLEQETYIVEVMRKLESSVAVNNVRCVQFRPRVSSDQYYITIQNGQGCSSYVGQNAGLTMNRTVTLESPGCLSDGVVMHELLHTLGFYHEQSRPDRDNYVRVNLENVVSGMESNFAKYPNFTATDLNTPYDYRSVMHYGRTAFSRNGLPTIEPIQPANMTIGQRDNLSSIDVYAVRTLYNCTAVGVTLPPTTTPNTAYLYAANATYSSRWTTSSPSFTRYNGLNSSHYYYEAIRVTVSISGYYRFKSNSAVDTFGYLYMDSFWPMSPSINLRTQDDDTGGNNQFQFTVNLQANTTYILVVTTYSSNVVGTFDVTVSGQVRPMLQPLNNTGTVPWTTPATTASSTTNYMLTSNYRGELTNNSATYTRYGGTGQYYYEAIVVTVSVTGNYTLASNSSIDTYGYLYANTVNATDLSADLLTLDDDSAGGSQFRLSYTLQTGRRYILLVTTFSTNMMARFAVIASGPSQITLNSVNLTLTLPYVSTVSTTVASSSPSTITGGSNSTITYSSALNTTGPTYTRVGGFGRFFYEALEVSVSASGNYTFISNSNVDTYGYLYESTINASNLSTNLLASDDDSAGYRQFQITFALQVGRTYILILTTFSPDTIASFSISASGPTRMNLRRLNLTLSLPYSGTTLSTFAPTVSTTSSDAFTNSYSSVLTNNSATYARLGRLERFYYEAIEVTVPVTGGYTFVSNSTVDAYGYLYINPINATDLAANLLIYDDDSGGNAQFRIGYSLQVNRTYILIFTTYASDVTTSFSISAFGAGRVNFRRLSLMLSLPYSSTTLRMTTPQSSATSISMITNSYNSVLSDNSATFTRHGGFGRYFYVAIEMNVTITGVYTFVSNSTIDTYGYLYTNPVNAADLSANLLTSDDDSAGNAQFLITYTLQAGSSYILLFTTYRPDATAAFSMLASGPGAIGLRSVNLTFILPYISTVSPSTISVSSTTRNSFAMSSYSSALTISSAAYTRFGGSGQYFYEAIELNVSATGAYTFVSDSTVNAYGYLYISPINATDLRTNLLVYDDDSAGNSQFRMGYSLQASRTYILIFTTYSVNLTTTFSVSGSGPGSINFGRLNLPLLVVSTTTPSAYSTSSSPVPTVSRVLTACNRSNDEGTCPVPTTTNGRVVPSASTNGLILDRFFPSNTTFFNRNDSSPANGYVQSVTVQYHRLRLPTATARVWIYAIIPIAGSYMTCSQYLIPSSQISTQQTIQTYTIPNNIINVVEKTYVGVGIQDTSAALVATSGSIALRTDKGDLAADVVARAPVYFLPDNAQNGVKISYTVVS